MSKMSNVTVCSLQGHRTTMEDRYIVDTDLLNDGGSMKLFAVFDGHGGSWCVDLLHQNYKRVLQQCICAQREIKKDLDKEEVEAALADSFRICDVLLWQDFQRTVNASGSTAAVVLIVNGIVYCANVGDTEVVIGDGCSLEVLTFVHKPSIISERQRIEAAGGFVTMYGGMLRVCATLAVSRAFGNFSLQTADGKRIIDATPHISSCPLEPGQALIIACDGLWDVYAYDAAIAEALKVRRNPATHLANAAIEKFSRDNVTTIVVLNVAVEEELATTSCELVQRADETPPLP